MFLEIFDVQHGACALLTDAGGKHVMIDCGHNVMRGWYPGDELAARGIDEIETLIVTNYDEDHVSGIENLFSNVNVKSILRNRKVRPQDIKRLKSEFGMGRGIDFLVTTLERWSATGSTSVPMNERGFLGVEFECFRHGMSEFDDENNLSLVCFITIGGVRFVFPGDTEKAAWELFLQDPQFVSALSQVNVFVASHHGRQSGICEDVFRHCTPHFIVFSDKQKGHQTQETVDWYRRRAKSGVYKNEIRRVLTTRRDGNICFEMKGEGSFDVY